jgi:DNA-binding IclR family transcriptional regulator
MRDRRLRGAAFPVLYFLWDAGVLDMLAWRVCKTEALARDLGRDQSTVYRALDDLRRCGYVERHPRDLLSWRLIWAPAALAELQAVVTERDGEASAA